MDFVKCLIKSQCNLCFLCFKKSENLQDITEELYIYDENIHTTSSIRKMVSFLFPSREILFEEVCEICSDLILSMYLTLRRHDVKKMLYSIIIDNLVKNVDDIQPHKSIKLHIKVPNYGDIESELNKTDLKIDDSKLNEPCEPINTVLKNEATVCDKCGKDFKNTKALKSHLKCHCVKSCPYCSKILKTDLLYKLHVKSHEGILIKKERRKQGNFLYCNDCEYRSLKKCGLEAHINKCHLHTRSYVCEICTKGFYKKGNLTEHVKTHRNTKNWTCELCGDSFVHKKTLAEHSRLHSGEKPYECGLCKANFVTSGRRSDHIKRKHGDKNECCDICGKKYSLKKDLNRHVKTVHVQGAESSKTQFNQTNYEFLDENGDVLQVLGSV